MPAFAVRPVTITALEQQLADARQLPDDSLAAVLSEMQLTERFPSAELPRLLANLPGDKSREALRVLT